jgi:hypothetical protein
MNTGRHVFMFAIAPIASVLAILVTPAMGQGALPDPARTPGALNPAVIQQTIRSTICVRGWTRTVDYEEDHLIPLDLGGSPTDPHNLWPEPRLSPDGWNADLKDELEGVLARLVCSGRVPLAEAQQAIAADWTSAYRRYVTEGQ